MKLQRQEIPDSLPSQYIEDDYGNTFESSDNLDLDDESDLPEYMEELDDYSLKITLSKGLVVILRDMTGDDLTYLNKIRKGIPHPTIKGRTVIPDEIDLIKKIVSHLCIQWGDQTSVTPPEIGKIRAKDFGRLGKALEHFQTL